MKHLIAERAKEYSFMWGQKQSVMVTEAQSHAVGPAGTHMTEGVREHLQVLDSGIASMYFPDTSIEEWRQNGSKYFDRNFTKQIFDEIDGFVVDQKAFSERVLKDNLSEASNQELIMLMAGHRLSIRHTLVLFATSSTGSTYRVEQKIKDILERKLGDDPRVQEYFMALTTPAELDETMIERIDFAELAAKTGVSDDDLMDYGYRYPALFMNTYNEEEVLSFLQARLEEYRSSDKLQHEGEVIKESLWQIQDKHVEIEKIFDNEELTYLGSIIQRAALGRYRLKHVWSGAEFSHLRLLREVASRLEVSFDDMMAAYRYTDVEAFLRDGVRLSEQEIKARRRGVVIHWIDGELNFLSGEEGLKYAQDLIAVGNEASNELKEVKGQVASRGNVQGKARVVFVEDLKQFVKDSEDFKEGEILVTTMTSPIMIPIIAKAVGIVTDEGGIASHAAVSAREFKIPCVVGTKNGTKVFKTGGEIELNAEQGVVRVIQRHAD